MNNQTETDKLADQIVKEVTGTSFLKKTEPKYKSEPSYERFTLVITEDDAELDRICQFAVISDMDSTIEEDIRLFMYSQGVDGSFSFQYYDGLPADADYFCRIDKEGVYVEEEIDDSDIDEFEDAIENNNGKLKDWVDMCVKKGENGYGYILYQTTKLPTKNNHLTSCSH